MQLWNTTQPFTTENQAQYLHLGCYKLALCACPKMEPQGGQCHYLPSRLKGHSLNLSTRKWQVNPNGISPQSPGLLLGNFSHVEGRKAQTGPSIAAEERDNPIQHLIRLILNAGQQLL